MKKGPRMHLKGKTALVTGSTSGIGLGIAKALAGHGAAVIINGFGDADAIEAERAALAALNDGKAAYDGADLTKPEEIEAMFARADKDMGGVDILVNNAGTQFVSPIEDFPPEKRSEEHTSELQSLLRNPYAVFCLTTTNNRKHAYTYN